MEMRATVRAAAAILLLVTVAEATSSGWKPIPAPPGMYLTKPTLSRTQDHPILHEYRIESHQDEPSEINPDEEDLTRAVHDDFAHSSDSAKGFRSVVQIHEKRPTFSYSSFNSFHGKKQGKGPRKNDFKYIHSFSSNYLNPFHNAVGFGDDYHQQDNRCPLYKVSFRQDHYFQHIQYKVHMPDLKEFTLCLWSKFHNHSFDHPLFSYAVRHQPKAIYMWVSNTEHSNYYNMKINGHPIFRLNYPIRLYKWYHTCQSWNSKTGEWQVWVDGQRIGRGFHNLLVGHIIPGGGTAISGHEQRHYGGGFLKAAQLYKGSGGLLGEITMVQLYKIALSPGKAYTDHRHHHSHFTSTTPEPPDFSSEETPTTPEHPFLENGQLKKPLKVFELAESLRTMGKDPEQQQQQEQGFPDTFDGHFGQPYYGHSFSDHYGSTVNVIPFADHKIFKRNEGADSATESVKKVKFVTNPGAVVHVEKIKFALEQATDEPDWSEKVQRRKRSANETLADEQRFEIVDEGKTEPGSDEAADGARTGRSFGRKRPTRSGQASLHQGRAPSKRVSFPRTKNPRQRPDRKETLQTGESRYAFSKKFEQIGDVYHFQPIGHDFGFPDEPLTIHHVNDEKDHDDNPLHASGEDIIGPPQPEPAEHEVTRIMGICSGCDLDPYRKVVIISWRATPKKLFSGALFLRAKPDCRKF